MYPQCRYKSNGLVRKFPFTHHYHQFYAPQTNAAISECDETRVSMTLENRVSRSHIPRDVLCRKRAILCFRWSSLWASWSWWTPSGKLSSDLVFVNHSYSVFREACHPCVFPDNLLIKNFNIRSIQEYLSTRKLGLWGNYCRPSADINLAGDIVPSSAWSGISWSMTIRRYWQWVQWLCLGMVRNKGNMEKGFFANKEKAEKTSTRKIDYWGIGLSPVQFDSPTRGSVGFRLSFCVWSRVRIYEGVGDI